VTKLTHPAEIVSVEISVVYVATVKTSVASLSEMLPTFTTLRFSEHSLRSDKEGHRKIVEAICSIHMLLFLRFQDDPFTHLDQELLPF
jgi:hypothetical protein